MKMKGSELNFLFCGAAGGRRPFCLVIDILRTIREKGQQQRRQKMVMRVLHQHREFVTGGCVVFCAQLSEVALVDGSLFFRPRYSSGRVCGASAAP